MLNFIIYSLLITNWLLIWIILYLIIPIPAKINKSKNSKEFYEYNSNFLSILHAVLIVILSFKISIETGFSDSPYDNNDVTNVVLKISITYFIIDFLMGIILKYNDKVMTVHHIFAIIGCSYGLIKGRYGNSSLYALFLAELSNPFILLSKNLSKTNIAKKFVSFFGIIFCILYLITRTYFIYLIFIPYNKENSNFFFLIIMGLNWHVSLFWGFIILYKFIKGLYDILKWNFLNLIVNLWKKIKRKILYKIFIQILIISICYKNVYCLEFTDWI